MRRYLSRPERLLAYILKYSLGSTKAVVAGLDGIKCKRSAWYLNYSNHNDWERSNWGIEV